MKWVRSYAKDIETCINSGRSFVWDPQYCEPCFISEFNYYDMFKSAEESIMLLEWDIAISKEDRRTFEKYCEAEPDIIHVAPYRHYHYRNAYTAYSTIHRYAWRVFVREGDPFCFYFGFGLIYLPLDMMKDFVEAADGRMDVQDDLDATYSLTPGLATDTYFSWWHATTTDKRPVPIHWDINTIHLNWTTPTHEPY